MTAAEPRRARRALREKIAQKKRAEELRRYVNGYTRAPETADEVATAEASVAQLLAEEPWEPTGPPARR